MIVIKRASFLVTVLNNLTTSAYNEVILEIYDKLGRYTMKGLGARMIIC
jgi:hypothetical protein